MNRHIGFKALGTAVFVLELFVEFLAIGPLGWAVIGAVRVHERHAGAGAEPGESPAYCGYCGSEFGEKSPRSGRTSASGSASGHCPICGAPMSLGSGDGTDD
jgi:hypothetical protein